jgi:uncharacterized membrane protein HdeD (DUF308 family)
MVTMALGAVFSIAMPVMSAWLIVLLHGTSGLLGWALLSLRRGGARKKR